MPDLHDPSGQLPDHADGVAAVALLDHVWLQDNDGNRVVVPDQKEVNKKGSRGQKSRSPVKDVERKVVGAIPGLIFTSSIPDIDCF